MSNKKNIPERVVEILRKNQSTYLEVGQVIWGKGFGEKEKGYLKLVFHRLKKRGTIKPTAERRQRCAVYKTEIEENMTFIKGSDLDALEKGYQGYFNLFEKVFDKDNIIKISKGGATLLRGLVKDNIDFSVINYIRKKDSPEKE